MYIYITCFLPTHLHPHNIQKKGNRKNMKKRLNHIGMCLFNNTNKYKLSGFWLVGETEDEKKNAIVLILYNEYRKLKADLYITHDGTIWISDYYGENMERDTMDVVKNGYYYG